MTENISVKPCNLNIQESCKFKILLVLLIMIRMLTIIYVYFEMYYALLQNSNYTDTCLSNLLDVKCFDPFSPYRQPLTGQRNLNTPSCVALPSFTCFAIDRSAASWTQFIKMIYRLKQLNRLNFILVSEWVEAWAPKSNFFFTYLGWEYNRPIEAYPLHDSYIIFRLYEIFHHAFMFLTWSVLLKGAQLVAKI